MLVDQILQYDLQTDRVWLKEEYMEIKEFKALWSRDRGSPGDTQGRKKTMAQKEFAMIFHSNSPKSPYFSYPRRERIEILTNDLFDEKWAPDQVFNEAENKYQELTKTASVRLVENSLHAVHATSEFLGSIDYKQTGSDRNGNEYLLYDPEKVLKMVGSVQPAVDGLKKLLSNLQKEQDEQATIRRGIEVNEFTEG